MIIYPDQKILFVHIPKNGGACFLNYAKENNKRWKLYRGTHSAIEEEDVEKFSGWSIVTIVRNTYSRMVSLYRFNCLIRKAVEHSSFEDFVFNFNLKDSFDQLNYITVKDKIVADRILIYSGDTLVDNINKVFGDKAFIVPKKNETTHYYGQYDFKEYYTEKAKKEVDRLCAKEISLFGFDY